MSRTSRKTRRDHDGTLPQRPKPHGRRAREEAFLLAMSDVTRLAAFPIGDYPEGCYPLLVEPGGRIMAVHPDSESWVEPEYDQWLAFRADHPELD